MNAQNHNNLMNDSAAAASNPIIYRIKNVENTSFDQNKMIKPVRLMFVALDKMIKPERLKFVASDKIIKPERIKFVN